MSVQVRISQGLGADRSAFIPLVSSSPSSPLPPDPLLAPFDTIIATRIDAGGKLLTNHLKELVSFRQWYMMDQTSVIEHAKEECCYVTNQWNVDWEVAK